MKAETFDVVRYYDPEVERHADIGKTMDYRHHRDLEQLGLPEDAKPVVFRCKLLSRDQRRMVDALQHDGQRYELAFRFGLVSVANLPRPDGTLETVAPPRSKAKEPLSDDALDALGLGDDDLKEIGSVIVAKSFLALGVPLWCPVLDSSERAWLAVAASRRVEQSRGSETTEGDE